MDYFLQAFGGITIGTAAIVIGAVVFLRACYKKIEKYFSEKAIREQKKDEKLQQVINQAEQYSLWHQQSIDIRDKLNGAIDDLGSKVDLVNKAIGELRKENSESRATTCRYRILRFDDEIRHGDRHSKEHFDQVLEDITEYVKYCDVHPEYKNNKAVLAIRNIERVYQKCTSDGSFL